MGADISVPEPDQTKQKDNPKTTDNKPNKAPHIVDKKQANVVKPIDNRPFSQEVLIERCYGCLIGAAIGDSIGSFCEFRSNAIEKDELDEAMQMPGGGTWGGKVITGQVTDDTELAVSLAYGLMAIIGKAQQMRRLKTGQNVAKNEQILTTNDSKSNIDIDCDEAETKENKETHIFNLCPIGIEYRRWLDSRPFDIGICTRHTLRASPGISEMKECAFDYNKKQTKGNEANGAMMRCMPLCLYGYRLEDKDNLSKLMKEDASLTHANSMVYLSNTCYAIMIQYLLKAEPCNDKRNVQAFDEVFEYLETVTQTIDENSAECKAAQLLLDDWLTPFLNSKTVSTGDYSLSDLEAATGSQGWVKIAFQRCCYHLLRGNSYSEAIRSVVGEGGDSDTNACIVGGVMGAYWGINGIPKQYVENIKNCSPIRDNARDKFQAKWYFKDKIVELLIQNAPSDESLKFVEKY